jgi:hypothetical protein
MHPLSMPTTHLAIASPIRSLIALVVETAQVLADWPDRREAHAVILQVLQGGT